MVECLVWDQDAAGSSPVTSTKYIPPTNVLLKLFVLQAVKNIDLPTNPTNVLLKLFVGGFFALWVVFGQESDFGSLIL